MKLWLMSCLFLSMVTTVRATDLYVSALGNDANTGTKDRPLQTLPAAQKAARSKKSDGPLTIHIAAER